MIHLKFSFQHFAICFALVFGFCLSNITAWLYASNPTFLDGIPLFFLGGLICSSVLIGSLFYLFVFLMAQIPIIKKIVKPRQRLITIITLCIALIWLITPVWIGVMSWQANNKPLESPPKLLVIGLDAAIWDLIDPWLEDGTLPHLKRIKDQGVSTTLKSIDPMRSPSLWTTICTGVAPEHHGISGFFSTRRDLKTARIWDVMTANGLEVGLFRWLLTSPPERKFAFCIPAWLARDAETHPMPYHILQEINLEQSVGGGTLKKCNALFDAATHGAGICSVEKLALFYVNDYYGLDDEAHLAQKMLAEVPLQRDVFIHLLQNHQPDVATFTFYGTDKLAHRFWHYMEPDAFAGHEFEHKPEYEGVIREYYQAADKAIGEILAKLDEDTTVVVLSDHGMKADPAMPRQYFLDTHALLEQLQVEELFRHHNIMRQTFLEPVVNDPLLLEETKSALQSMRFEDGDSVFRVIIENGKIVLRTNFSLTYNPDSPLILNNEVIYNEQSISTKKLFFLRTFSGTHDINGILMIRGPHIKEGILINPAQLVDIAPTLLYVMNQPISRTIEGAVIEEAFDPDWLAKHAVHYVEQYENISIDLPPQESNEAFLERLRSMGYVE